MKTVARALVSSHIWPTEGQIWGTLVGGAETSPHAGDHKLVHPSLNLPKASHLLEMTNLFAHLDECGAPEEGIRKGFARLLTQVRKLANLDWIRKEASAMLERVLRCGTERLRDQEKPYEDYRM